MQVQREAFKLWPLRIRCGFLGPGSISQVTVNWGGHDDAGGTLLAVLHPEFGVHCQAPVCQAQWETKSTIAVMLEGSEARSSWANATFCCKFVSFPDGSQETCGYPQSGSVEHSSDQGGAGEEGLGTGRALAQAVHLKPLFVSRVPCPDSSPHSASRPGLDLGGLRAPPLGLHLCLLCAPAEALVRLCSV